MLFFLLTVATSTWSQSSVKVFTEAPLQFGLGYEGKLSKRFSVSAQAGVLTDPYSSVIISLLESFGTDPQITLMIDEAFKFGLVAEGGVNYHFGKNYVGVFGQYIGLQAGDTPTSLIENYFGENISQYPTRKGRSSSVPRELQLKSVLYQAGVLYGRRFHLKNPKVELFAELGISANVGSKSTLSESNYDLSSLSNVVDEELANYYSTYCFIPSLTLGLSYKFGRSRNGM